MGYSAKKPHTFFVHDYETYGTNPQIDAVSQFAGIRTDADLNILPDGENDYVNIFCQITPDYLPSPEACLVTRITPQLVQRKAMQERRDALIPKERTVLNEDQFAKRINDILSKPSTCSIGYNSIKFDDEVTRNILYRTLRDPYKREWNMGCSRGEGMNIVRFAYLVDPTIINFPDRLDAEGNVLLTTDGKPQKSVRLEELSAANNIVHANAHDAMADVYALIGILKLIKERNAPLFDFCIEHRKTKQMDDFLLQHFSEPLVHVSSFYGSANRSLGIVQQICKDPDPKNKNVIYAVNLLADLTDLVTVDEETLKERLFAKKDALLEMGVKRPPIQTIGKNKCPMLAPLSWIENNHTLSVDPTFLESQSAYLKEHFELIKMKLEGIFKAQEFESDDTDVDRMIYGGFADNDDKTQMENVHRAIERGEFSGMEFNSQNDNVLNKEKFNRVFWRFKARNYPQVLPDREKRMWRLFEIERVTGENALDATKPLKFAKQGGSLLLREYLETINTLKAKHQGDEAKLVILKDLIEYAKSILHDHPVSLAIIENSQ
jgi:exodeoxyribonuclease-1